MVLRPARDQLVAETELLDEADASLLPREEAVGRLLDHEPVDALGLKLPAEDGVALDEHELRLGAMSLQPARGCSPAIPPPTTTTSHAADLNLRAHELGECAR